MLKVRFRTVDGDEIVTGFKVDEASLLGPGVTVPIVYDPARPTLAALDAWSGSGHMRHAVRCGLISAGFFGVMLLFLLA